MATMMEIAGKVDWTTVLVALATGLSAAYGNVWLSIKQAKRERTSVRAALLAEVGALVELCDRREYLPYIREVAEYLEALTDEQLEEFAEDAFFLKVPISEHYNRVYQENVGRLGTLSVDEARQIVRFYQLVDSVRSDVTENGVLYEGCKQEIVWRETAGVLESALEIGRRLTSERVPMWRRWIQRGRNVDASLN
ncbi:hypothetical protein [Stutzerimonas stutzeri]|uniref:DUF4760 domain-containing protein n=1 Tax=Stutzerimonas stutzeri KOS6 TaxID=1218352 RepID=A0A061JUI3_STUST|nr:hypothetical protein [Stutzerimonas stutzeri]EWC43381.1 hypothetical protein B597_001885 [Stutzerimonas stutzeri KOS6]